MQQERPKKKQKISEEQVTTSSKEEIGSTEKITTNKSTFFPDDVLKTVFCHLDKKSILSAKLTCKKWHQLANQVQNNHDHYFTFADLLVNGSLSEAHQCLMANNVMVGLYFRFYDSERTTPTLLHFLARKIPQNEEEKQLFIEIFDSLLKRGADINAIYERLTYDTEDNNKVIEVLPYTVLMSAISRKNKFYFDLLLKKNVNCNVYFQDARYVRDGAAWGIAYEASISDDEDEDNKDEYYFKTLLQQKNLIFDADFVYRFLHNDIDRNDPLLESFVHTLVDRHNQFMKDRDQLQEENLRLARLVKKQDEELAILKSLSVGSINP